MHRHRSILALGALLFVTPLARAADAPYQPTPADLAALQQVITSAKAGDLPAAMTQTLALRKAHPAWPDPLLLQAQIYGLQHELLLARNAFRAAAELDPANHDALLGLATTSLQLNDPPAALAALDRLVAAAPSDGEVALLRAQALIANHQKPEAAKYLAALLAGVKGPGRANALALIVPLQLKAEDFAAANTTATEWTLAAPSPDAYAYRADAHRGLQQYDSAAADLGEALKLSNGQPTFPLMFISAHLLLDKGDPAAALTQLVDLLELAPANPEVEAAIADAVVARQAQLRAAPAGDQHLIPPINYGANLQFIDQWNVRAAVGRERARTQLEQLSLAQSHGDAPARDVVAAARAIYPAHEIYAADLLLNAPFAAAPAEEFPAPESPAAKLEQALTDARVAAALAALRAARHGTGVDLTVTTTTGYLQWADFLQHLKTSALTDTDTLLLKAHAIETSHDISGALDAYLQAEKVLLPFPTGPASALAQRILNSPALLQSLINDGVKQVDAAIARNDAARALSLADRLVVLATRSSQNITPSPTLAAAYVAKDKALRAAKDPTKAAEALAAALKADPLSEDAHFLLASDLALAGLNDQAMLEYNLAAHGQVSATNQDSALVTSALAARLKLERLRRIPEIQNIYAAAGDAAYKDKNWAAAFAAGTRLQSGFDAPAAGTFGIAGVGAVNLGRYEDAVTNLTTAMKLDPKLNLHSQLASAHASLHHHQQAIDEYTAALKLEPTAPWPLRGRAASYVALEKFSLAAADLQIIVDHQEPNALTLIDLADALSHTDSDTAAVVYQRAITLLTPLADLFADNALELLQAKARLVLLQRPPAVQ